MDHSPYINYRPYISEDWAGTPTEGPAGTVEDDSVFVSCNGATKVAQWRLPSGADEETAEFRDVADRDGFETSPPATSTTPDGTRPEATHTEGTGHRPFLYSAVS